MFGIPPILPRLPINYLIQDKIPILRIQNKAQEGPYRSHGSRRTHPRYVEFEAMISRHSSPVTHPSVRSDPGFGGISEWDFPFKKYRFGFTSVEQMHEWFAEGELSVLEDMGFYLSIFLVPVTQHLCGFHQCVFNLEESSMLLTLEPTTPKTELERILNGLYV